MTVVGSGANHVGSNTVLAALTEADVANISQWALSSNQVPHDLEVAHTRRLYNEGRLAVVQVVLRVMLERSHLVRWILQVDSLFNQMCEYFCIFASDCSLST